MTENEKKLLEKYFHACVNFYYVIPLRQVYKIIKLHDELKITKEDFYAYAAERREQNAENYIYGIFGSDEWYADEEESPIERCELVADFLYDTPGDEEPPYYEFVKMRATCPWYIPNAEELLKWTDDSYENENPYAKKAADFVVKALNLTGIPEENFRDGLPLWIRMSINNPIEEVFDWMEVEGITLTKKQANEFIPLLVELNDHTRLPLLHGFMPCEVENM